MPPNQACRYCQNPAGQVTKYSNFKHYWYRCSACGTMWRVNKSTYPLSSFLRFTDSVPLFRKVERRLLPSYIRKQDAEEEAYQSYGQLFKMILENHHGNEMFEVKRRRYLSEASDFLELMKKHNIDVSTKCILDISGGPGTFAHFIKPSVREVVVTEYGENSVRTMSQYLPGIKVMHADINNEWTDTNTYDIILYRSCLYFCNDFDKHLQDISKFLKPGGIIYICTTAPSMGNSLRWQYEDYTHNVLYSQQVITGIFSKHNFSVLDKGLTDFYPHFLNHYSLRDKLFHSWGVWNILRKGTPKGLDARAHWVLASR